MLQVNKNRDANVIRELNNNIENLKKQIALNNQNVQNVVDNQQNVELKRQVAQLTDSLNKIDREKASIQRELELRMAQAPGDDGREAVILDIRAKLENSMGKERELLNDAQALKMTNANLEKDWNRILRELEEAKRANNALQGQKLGLEQKIHDISQKNENELNNMRLQANSEINRINENNRVLKARNDQIAYELEGLRQDNSVNGQNLRNQLDAERKRNQELTAKNLAELQQREMQQQP